MGSYGSLLRFSNIERLIRVGDETIVGISGDISDLQHIERLCTNWKQKKKSTIAMGPQLACSPRARVLDEALVQQKAEDGPCGTPSLLPASTMTEVLHEICGSFGCGVRGTGSCYRLWPHLAIPLLRKLVPYDSDYEKVTKEEAHEAILNSMRVLYYRDARAGDKFTLAVLTFEDGKVNVSFEQNQKVENQNWQFAKNIIGYGSKQL
ncbi:hypothetical protein CJJ09_005645 [Candidozyma auris]|nr:hypothetical protein CJJ09_005645 [[Candida] auris]